MYSIEKTRVGIYTVIDSDQNTVAECRDRNVAENVLKGLLLIAAIDSHWNIKSDEPISGADLVDVVVTEYHRRPKYKK